MADNWHIIEDDIPENNYQHKETVFTLGNGYFSSRGSFEEGFPGEIATTFVHGVFNDVPTFSTELVNFPKWFSLRIIIDGEQFSLDQGHIRFYERCLNMSNGVLARHLSWESPGGKCATIIFERFIDMANIHHGVVRFTLKDFNFSGDVQIHADIPGVVFNERYRHWRHVVQGQLRENGCFLELETLDTHISAGIAQVVNIDSELPYTQQYWDSKWMPTQVYGFTVHAGDVISGTKHTAIFTSREVNLPGQRAKNAVMQFSKMGFSQALEENDKIWQDLWDRSNVVIKGDDVADRALRYNLFQILIAAPRHDDTVSIGAKTLSGFGYRGHVFWDTEIFILPFLIFTQPAIAKNLLLYRYQTLPGARANAIKHGFNGAMFAWESASTGKDVTPSWVTGPDGEHIKIWCGEIEQHITADVAYGVNQYWQVTGDDDFMRDYGAEIIISAAQFYASRLEKVTETGLYHIRDVIGPDEYHEHVDDNAMTNLMAGWVLKKGRQVADWLNQNHPDRYKVLLKETAITENEMASWLHMSQKIAINERPNGVIEQFSGYFDLTYLDQAALEPREQSLQSMFGVEGVQQYQFIKQPDVVMALYLLREQFSRQTIFQNLAFYTPRTDLSYGSSLGPSIQALMLARMDHSNAAKELFIKTLLTDLEDNRGNTQDGIHAASAGAVWQVILFGFLGCDVKNGLPTVNPAMPEGWEKVKISIIWKNQRFQFDNS